MKMTKMYSVISQVTELAGYTARVYEMFEVFEDVRVGVYRRSASEVKPEESGVAGKIKHGMRVEGPLQIRGLIKFYFYLF